MSHMMSSLFLEYLSYYNHTLEGSIIIVAANLHECCNYVYTMMENQLFIKNARVQACCLVTVLIYDNL